LTGTFFVLRLTEYFSAAPNLNELKELTKMNALMTSTAKNIALAAMGWTSSVAVCGSVQVNDIKGSFGVSDCKQEQSTNEHQFKRNTESPGGKVH
jgi:hypothetical protein